MPVRDELYGRTVGEFVLRERIGEGGYGAVYRCEQPALGREAVVKVLHHKLRGNDVVRQRFLREARLASRLDHPYAAHVYAFGIERDDGMFWIAMEMVHGTTLDDWLDEHGRLPLEQLVPFFERVAEVVHTAHERGIVHRDLKPSNIMVIERAGRLLPKLLDFGIAKMHDDTPPVDPGRAGPRSAGNSVCISTSGARLSPVDSTGDDPRPFGNAGVPPPCAGLSQIAALPPPPLPLPGGQTLTSTGDPAARTIPDRQPPLPAGQSPTDSEPAERAGAALTHANATLGSPPYMSPEQWSDPLRVGPRSDLYALGIIAYEALTGRRPFSAPTALALAELHCRADVPPVGPEFPPALDGLFRRALAKQVDDRPGSALELAEALRTASGLAATPPHIDRPKTGRSWLPLGVGVALVAAGAATMVWILAGPRDGMASREVAPPAHAPANAAVDAGPASEPAPPRVPVRLESVPAGADVFRLPSEVKVGVTPWDAELERADGVAVFVVRKRGYVDQQVEVDMRTGARSRVRLSPVPPVHPRDGHDRVDRHKGEPADPFTVHPR